MENLRDALYAQSNLTRRQLLIWSTQVRYPDSSQYSVAYRFDIQGPLEIDRFRSAFSQLIRSSDALRTIIQVQEGVPKQVVLKEPAAELVYRDFSHEPEPREVADQFINSQHVKPVSLGQSLFASWLLRIGSHDYAWIFCAHHLIVDGYAFQNIYDRLRQLYDDQTVHSYPQYCDYLAVERERLIGDAAETRASFWRVRLTKAEERISIYGQAIDGDVFSTHKLRTWLEKDHAQALSKLAREPRFFVKNERVTRANIFMAVMAALLARITDRQRFSIGMPLHNRDFQSFRETIGLFMEIYPLEFDFSQDMTFADLLKAIEAQMTEAKN